MRGSSGFEKRKRIRRSQEFQSVYTEGKKLYTPFFVLYFRQRGAAEPRVGLTVSKKVGNSVERSRCKRLLREVFRRHQSDIPKGFDLVFNARRALLSAAFEMVNLEFEKCIPRLLIQCEGRQASLSGHIN